MKNRITEVEDVNDFFLLEYMRPAEKPIYMICWESNTDYISIVKADEKEPKRFITMDNIEVPIIMPNVNSDESKVELQKFLDYIVENCEQLGVRCFPEKEAIRELDKTFGNIVRYKNILVKHDSLVMPSDGEKYGMGLLDAERMIIIKPQ